MTRPKLSTARRPLSAPFVATMLAALASSIPTLGHAGSPDKPVKLGMMDNMGMGGMMQHMDNMMGMNVSQPGQMPGPQAQMNMRQGNQPMPGMQGSGSGDGMQPGQMGGMERGRMGMGSGGQGATPQGATPGMRMPGMTTDWGPVDLTDRIEGRLAFMRAELRITDAQATSWNAFAEALKLSRQHLLEARQQLAQPNAAAAQRMEQYEAHLTARLNAVKSARTAFAQLYSSLDENQKRTADELIVPFVATF